MSHDFTSRDNEAIKSWKRQFRRSLCRMQAAAPLWSSAGCAPATGLFPCPLPLSDVKPSSIAAARANIGNRSTPIDAAKKKEHRRRHRIPLGVRLHYLFFLDRQQRFSKAAISLQRPQWQQKRKERAVAVHFFCMHRINLSDALALRIKSNFLPITRRLTSFLFLSF
jgi:hypothetical protein